MTDAVTFAAHFNDALRAHGVYAGMRRTQTLAQTLRAFPPQSTSDLYWRARVSMLPDVNDLAAFHAAFIAYAGGDADAMANLAAGVDAGPPPREAPKRESLPPAPSERTADAEHARRAPVQLIAASAHEALRERDFDDISETEQAEMLALIARVRFAAEYRSTRRRRKDRVGDRFDFRSSLRAATRTAGEIVDRQSTRRKQRLRPLIFFIDVSGSMAPFARALLQYARVNAVARANVHAFTFATRLTDVTPLLKHASNAALMNGIGAHVPDYGGGTRIGAALRTFNDRYAQRGIARGGTVVVVSDGWERDDPAVVRDEMARLRRLTRRIVWVNPQKRHVAYEPLAGGMAAALPYLDAFISGHSVRTLGDVADAIEGTHR